MGFESGFIKKILIIITVITEHDRDNEDFIWLNCPMLMHAIKSFVHISKAKGVDNTSLFELRNPDDLHK